MVIMYKFIIQIIEEESEEIFNEITLPLNSGITIRLGDRKINIDIKESNLDVDGAS